MTGMSWLLKSSTDDPPVTNYPQQLKTKPAEKRPFWEELSSAAETPIKPPRPKKQLKNQGFVKETVSGEESGHVGSALELFDSGQPLKRKAANERMQFLVEDFQKTPLDNYMQHVHVQNRRHEDKKRSHKEAKMCHEKRRGDEEENRRRKNEDDAQRHFADMYTHDMYTHHHSKRTRG